MGEVKMTKQEAIEFLAAYIAESGKTQTAVAGELGISAGALSGFLKDEYKAPHTIIPKVEDLARMHEKKKVSPKEPDFAETNIFKIVNNAITYCHIQGKIAVVYGDAGIGKTQAVKEYLRRSPLAIGITISPTYANISGVNELIAEQLGVRERVARKITSEITNKLRGSGRVLIIDEAQHLTVRTINHLRCIADESGCGICLIGNDEVYSKMKGSGRADFAQIFSRIGMRKNVLTSNITEADVEKVFGRYEMEDEAKKILFKICRTNYGLRGAVNVFVNTAAVFGEITGAGMAKVMRDMNIG